MTDARPVGPPRGVLPSGAGGSTRGEHLRFAPSPPLAPYLAHFWWVTWDVPAPVVVETLPHPTLHLVFETPADRGELSGVSLRRFTRTLTGRGRVFALKFRPAVFGALASRAVSTLRDRRSSPHETLASTALADALGAVGEAIRTVTRAEDAAQIAESLLRAAPWPPLSPPLRAIRDLVERIEHDRTLVRVDDAARVVGLDVRTLERRFRAWVGLTPKAVIGRYRLIEAAERVQREPATPLATIAVSLGYSDQAHFSRELRAVVGRTPRQLREAARP
ncbi:MAG: helix-turn-helix transcriptional regulator [Myxococcales bacterium]|nr:helix-turn-helix transcriptional regulator [Myxococcales bacterium]